MAVELRAFSWDRMIEAVQAVRDRALRATRALENAGIPYAMAGGNAVAAWVARVDRAAVRNTQDVELLVRRSDQIHLLDMLSLGLIDASWLPRLVPEHAARLQQLIDDPDG